MPYGRMKKSYLIAFINDHSRLIPHGEFYLSEKLTSFLDAFEKTLLKRGLPKKLYVVQNTWNILRHP
jgi:hypothetical protein